MKLKVSLFFVIMLISLIISRSYLSLCALLAAALHELGHIAVAKLRSIPLSELRLGIFGASLTTDIPFCSYKNEIFLASAGPLANIASFLLAFTIRSFLGELGEFFLVSSLFLAILNLLPIDDLDGGRILKCVLLYNTSPKVSYTVCKALSFSTVFCLWVLSVYLLLRLAASLSLFIFSLALFCKIFWGKNI